jgi:hypothetical protein
VKYRLDHTYTDLASGWSTSMGTVAAGETTFNFGSSLGVAFNAIQFRFDLAGSSATPDIQWAKLKYLKLLPAMWGWTISIDCTKEYEGRAPSQLVEALVTAVETETLVPFIFSVDSSKAPETKYVKVKSIIGLSPTGENKEGQYTIQVIEV